MKRRLDAELVRRKLARSRAHALELVAAGSVSIDGRPASKAATQVDGAQAVTVTTSQPSQYVSRGGYKLAGALDALGPAAPAIQDAICLDAGASTGGFTDVLVKRGAQLVFALDVGYGQLAWELRNHPKVKVIERTNVRYLLPGDLEPAPSLVVADLSFISLVTVLPALIAVSAPGAHLLPMVKPQFEVGKQALPAGGVVTDPGARAAAVWQVATAAISHGLAVLGVTASSLPGPSGNHEYFLHLTKQAGGLPEDQVKAAITNATGGEIT